VERDDRTAVASFLSSGPFDVNATLTLDEAAAHHARVKRLEVGDRVRITNGAGVVGVGSISSLTKREVDVTVERVESIPRLRPIHLRVPIGDRERMLWLAEKATELGIATWQAVRFRRSASVSPRGEGEAFAAKVIARMVSALEQSGGAWLPQVLPETDLTKLGSRDGEVRILLDAAGSPLASVLAERKEGDPVLLFGPEGGLERAELEELTAAGWRLATVGQTTLRFETAGLAAVAVCRNSFMLTES
jgi:16S rRNA (uracil1498-N3)-methyltransferase